MLREVCIRNSEGWRFSIWICREDEADTLALTQLQLDTRLAMRCPSTYNLVNQLERKLTMHTVGAFEAKAKIAELLDKVAAGETVLITRRGEAAALLIPPTKIHQDRAKALSEIKRFRKSCKTGKVNIEAFINEDRP